MKPLRIFAEKDSPPFILMELLGRVTETRYIRPEQYLTQIRKEVQLPLLRKDFIIDHYQVFESRLIGADAVLLIVRILGQRLAEFISLTRELGIAALTEVHTAAELEIAVAAGGGWTEH